MEEIEKLGICPVCKKGQIVTANIGFMCNYFKSFEDKCNFNIFKSYYGKIVTKEIVKELIDRGETSIYEDFETKLGVKFSASLKIFQEEKQAYVKAKFHKAVLQTPCPICKGNVEITKNSYLCEHYHPIDENACKLYIPRKICGKDISMENAEILLKGEKTPFIPGFRKQNGEEFTTRLYLNDALRIEFNNDLCHCPKCGGILYVSLKAYNCSNYQDKNIKCNFVIWREINGRKITEEEAIRLCSKGETEPLVFTNREGEKYEKKLIITEDFKVQVF